MTKEQDLKSHIGEFKELIRNLNIENRLLKEGFREIINYKSDKGYYYQTAVNIANRVFREIGETK